MDISAIVLNKLLTDKDIEVWAKLKLVFLDPAFSNLYSAISKFYDLHSSIPSFEELEITLREGPALKTLAILKLADEPEISVEVAMAALLDQYTQNQTISLLDKFIDKLPVYDSAEIKENLAGIVLTLDEKTMTTEGVYNMADIMLFKNAEELSRTRVHLGFNNTFDSQLAGVARQELILIGGKRGAGKSIVCSNIMASQYENGNTCVYFSIEMIAHEVLERNLAILADVAAQDVKQNKLSDADLLKVIKVRADMFVEADDLVEEFKVHRNKFKFEQSLVRDKELKTDNQMIIIDDRALSLTSIDLHLGKLKAKFGDKLTVAVIDYLNQVVLEGATTFDWQPQIIISKKLKDLARKYDIVIVSPYQIDATGEARFAKGILDAPDIALTLDAHDKEANAISFETAKIRGGREMRFTSQINWDTLRISPQSIEPPSKPIKEEKGKIKRVNKITNDEKSNIPWDV